MGLEKKPINERCYLIPFLVENLFSSLQMKIYFLFYFSIYLFFVPIFSPFPPKLVARVSRGNEKNQKKERSTSDRFLLHLCFLFFVHNGKTFIRHLQ